MNVLIDEMGFVAATGTITPEGSFWLAGEAKYPTHLSSVVDAPEHVTVGYQQAGGEWVAPVIVPTKKSREELKMERQQAVDAIRVTTQAGNTFDGDETSQGRMARAIIALQATGTPTVTWVLADNTAIDASAAELTEALALAGAAQAAIWVIE